MTLRLRTEDGLTTFGFLTYVLGTTAAVIGLIVALVLTLSNHAGHVACLRLYEQTGLETRYARSGPDGECYIHVNGRWTPEDRWRNLGGDTP